MLSPYDRKSMRARKVLSLAALSLAALTGVSSARIFDGGKAEAWFHGALRADARGDRQPAPARLLFGEKLKVANGALPSPPALTGISLALSPRIEMDTRGLPLCRLSQLTDNSSGEALRACGDARVGHGLLARQFSSSEILFGLAEHLIAFNGRYRGGPAILVHTEGMGKIRSRLVLALALEKPAGSAGYTLVSAFPPVMYEGRGTYRGWRVTEFTLSLGRSFGFKGERQSYLAASCPTAAELAAHFTVAHMTLDFGEEAEPLTGAVGGECSSSG